MEIPIKAFVFCALWDDFEARRAQMAASLVQRTILLMNPALWSASRVPKGVRSLNRGNLSVLARCGYSDAVWLMNGYFMIRKWLVIIGFISFFWFIACEILETGQPVDDDSQMLLGAFFIDF